MNTINHFVVLSLLIMLSGCATYTADYPSQPQTQPQPAPSAPAAVVTPQPDALPPSAPAVLVNPAALSLAKQSRSQYQRQDYQGAIATAERGLRIDRRAADLYLVLAQSYIQLAMPDKARMFTQQGLRFAQPGTEAAEGLHRVQQILNGY